jgi:signal transduction histidine kinase
VGPPYSRRRSRADPRAPALDDTPAAVLADGRTSRRILTNLIDNAARYSDGTVAESRAARNNDGQFALSVSDDGVGIPPEAREEVRKLGGRAQDSHLATNMGMGMGPWLVDMLASMHDAPIEIGAATNAGGCRVSITFPASRVVEPEDI